MPASGNELERLRRILRRDRAVLLEQLGAHGLGIIRSPSVAGRWALRAYVAPGSDRARPKRIVLTDDAGALEVEVITKETPPVKEESA